jgi:P-type conjugative transfer protein TrbJ
VYPAFGSTIHELGHNYENWSSQVDRTNQALTELSAIQLGDLTGQDEAREYDERINTLLTTPEGRMQAIQAGNQLAAMQLQEARELRALLATAAQEEAAFNAKQEKLNQAAEEHRRSVFEPRARMDPRNMGPE